MRTFMTCFSKQISVSVITIVVLLGFACRVSADADTDFVARRTAPGVFYFNGFDTSGDFSASSCSTGESGLTNADSCAGSRLWAQDMTDKKSGSSSLRIDIPLSYTGKSPGGFWKFFSAQPPGSTFYAQFAYKVTPTIFTNPSFGDGTSGVKLVNFFEHKI